jgi:hypothetical protein
MKPRQNRNNRKKIHHKKNKIENIILLIRAKSLKRKIINKINDKLLLNWNMKSNLSGF